jgi:WD40 repeat protein
MSSSGHRIVLGDRNGRIHIRDGETGQVLHSLEGHVAPPEKAAMSGSGHRIVSYDGDSLKLWDGVKAVLLYTLAEGGALDTRSICMSGNGRRVFTTGAAGEGQLYIHVWDCESGKVAMRLCCSLPVCCLSVSWDGNRIVAGSNDYSHLLSELTLWDGESGGRLCVLRTNDESTDIHHREGACISELCMSRSGHRFILTGHDNRLEIWDGTSLFLMYTLKQSDRNRAYCMVMSASGHRIVVSTGTQVEIWDGEIGELVRVLSVADRDGGDVVSISDSGHRITSIASMRYNDYEHTWAWTYELAAGRLWRSPRGEEGWNAPKRCICISPSGKSRIVSCTSPPYDSKRFGCRGRLSIWDGDLAEWLFDAYIDYVVTSAAMSHDGKRIVLCSPSQKEAPNDAPFYDMRIIDGDTGEVLLAMWGVHSDKVTAVCISPDGGRIVTCSLDKGIKMWDGITGELIRAFDGHSAAVTALCIALCDDSDSEQECESSNSKSFTHVISAGDDHTVKVWLARTGELLWALETGKQGIVSVCTDSDLKRIIVADQSSIQVWDGQARKLICNQGEKWCSDVRMDTAGRHFVSNGGSGVQAWDAQTGKLLRTLTAAFSRISVKSLAMSSSGDFIAWVDQFGKITVVENAGAYLPSASDIMAFVQTDAHRVSLPLVIGHFESSPSLMLEMVRTDGQWRNLLLAVIASLVSADAKGPPPSMAWVEQLLEAYPLVSYSGFSA